MNNIGRKWSKKGFKKTNISVLIADRWQSMQGTVYKFAMTLCLWGCNFAAKYLLKSSLFRLKKVFDMKSLIQSFRKCTCKDPRMFYMT